MSVRCNSVILAAGKSTSFAPFTYERPKGLFKVKGELLIERQIEQMIEAGIDEICIVIGYMKEKFFYLEKKYPQVRLVINNHFGTKGNLYSLYVARGYLRDTYVSYADYYFTENPFLEDRDKELSYHACLYRNGKFNEFSVDYNEANCITHVDIGGADKMAMVGHSYFTADFSKQFVSYLEREISDFRVSSLFWEEYFDRHVRDLNLLVKPYPGQSILEFNTIEDLRQFDSDFLDNVDSDIISNITATLGCNPGQIVDINVINAGLTNVSFRFSVGDRQYVYRHPGGTAGNLIDRTSELMMQNIARETGVDMSFITMTLDGWKLSYCVNDLVECDFRKYPEQLKKGMDFLRRIHSSAIPKNEDVCQIKTFDDYEEGLRLMKIASATKGNLLKEFEQEIAQAKQLSDYLKEDAERMGISLVCCHNDAYEPNFLVKKSGEMYMIDWEYAGLNDPANDLACFFCRYEYSQSDIDRFIEEYLQHKPSSDEYRHWMAYIPLCAFYWMGWGLYKGSVGDDDGFFFLPAYRNFHRFIDSALKSFE